MADLAALVVNLELQSAAFQRGMDQATRQMDKMQRTAKNVDVSTKRMADGLTAMGAAAISAAAAFASFETLKGIVQASDQLKALEGSFKALTGSGERAADMMGRIKSIAQETGAPLFSVGEAAQKLTVGLKSVGANNAQVAKITENFIKLGRVGGTSMNDINGALIQFAQGLASGKLQGDEFRSVMERIPLIGELLAKELGIGVEKLKEMASNGEITAKVMAEALLKATGDINAKFAELPQTAEQSFNRLKNQAALASAEIDSAFNLSGISSASFDALAGSLKNITQFIKDMSAAWGELDFGTKMTIAGTAAAALAGTFGGPLLLAIRAVGAAMVANPMLAILGAMAAAVLLVAANWDTVKLVLTYDLPKWLLLAEAAFSDLVSAIIKILGGIADAITNALVKPVRAAMEDWNKLKEVFGVFSKTPLPSLSAGTGDESANKAMEYGNQLRERAAVLDINRAGAAHQAMFAVQEASKSQDDLNQKLTTTGTVAETAAGGTQKQADALQQLLDKLFPAQAAARQLEADLKLLEQGFASGKLSAEQYAEAVAKAKEKMTGGTDSMKTAIDEIRDAVTGFAKDFTNQFVDALFTGKMNFKKFAEDISKTILKTLLNKQVQQFINLLTGTGGGAGGTGGGFFSFLGGLFGGGKAHGAAFNKGVEFFASGGVVGSPTAFGMSGGRFGVMGEAGPEAIIPLKRSASGDLGVRSSPVNITVNNNAPVDVAVSEKEDPNGMKQIEIMIDRRVSKGFSDGTYDKPLRGAFGLTRQGY
jgi:tape measure domain-containing protein